MDSTIACYPKKVGKCFIENGVWVIPLILSAVSTFLQLFKLRDICSELHSFLNFPPLIEFLSKSFRIVAFSPIFLSNCWIFVEFLSAGCQILEFLRIYFELLSKLFRNVIELLNCYNKFYRNFIELYRVALEILSNCCQIFLVFLSNWCWILDLLLNSFWNFVELI